jgi:hypothetical protein
MRCHGGCEMHDMIGGAGMLRGWVTMWTTQMLWLFPSLAVSVGAAAVVELLMAAHARRK